MIRRIKEIIAMYGISDRQFAIKCGIKQNTLSNQLNQARELSLASVVSILSSLNDISAEWLLRGNGTMLLSDDANKSEEEKRIAMLVDTITTLQSTINELTKANQVLSSENTRLKGEITMMKNERTA